MMKHFTKKTFEGLKVLMLAGLIFATAFANGQITITSDDMPDEGDTIRISNTLSTLGVDYTLTGEDYTWDFSILIPALQTVDTFESVSSVPFLYQLVFIPGIVANLAQPYSGLDMIPGVTITDAYRFYKNSSSDYKDVGFAATISSIPAPIKFDNPDILYDFPVSYGNVDSSFSNFQLGVPDIGYLGMDRKRVNTVDGWGTLTTPYGTFDVLRLKSQVWETDTIYIDSISYGTTIDRVYTEYKWLGNGKGEPLLQVTEEGPAVTVAYRDSIRNITVGIAEKELSANDVAVYPNPTGGNTTLSVNVEAAGMAEISVFNTTGMKIMELFNGRMQAGERRINFNVRSLPQGIYFIRMVLSGKVYSKKLIIER
jgi:hypothetical protein